MPKPNRYSAPARGARTATPRKTNRTERKGLASGTFRHEIPDEPDTPIVGSMGEPSRPPGPTPARSGWFTVDAFGAFTDNSLERDFQEILAMSEDIMRIPTGGIVRPGANAGLRPGEIPAMLHHSDERMIGPGDTGGSTSSSRSTLQVFPTVAYAQALENADARRREEEQQRRFPYPFAHFDFGNAEVRLLAGAELGADGYFWSGARQQRRWIIEGPTPQVVTPQPGNVDRSGTPPHVQAYLGSGNLYIGRGDLGVVNNMSLSMSAEAPTLSGGRLLDPADYTFTEVRETENGPGEISIENITVGPGSLPTQAEIQAIVDHANEPEDLPNPFGRLPPLDDQRFATEPPYSIMTNMRTGRSRIGDGNPPFEVREFESLCDDYHAMSMSRVGATATENLRIQEEYGARWRDHFAGFSLRGCNPQSIDHMCRALVEWLVADFMDHPESDTVGIIETRFSIREASRQSGFIQPSREHHYFMSSVDPEAQEADRVVINRVHDSINITHPGGLSAERVQALADAVFGGMRTMVMDDLRQTVSRLESGTRTETAEQQATRRAQEAQRARNTAEQDRQRRALQDVARRRRSAVTIAIADMSRASSNAAIALSQFSEMVAAFPTNLGVDGHYLRQRLKDMGINVVPDHPDAGKPVVPPRMRRTIQGQEVTRTRTKTGYIEVKAVDGQAPAYESKSKLFSRRKLGDKK